MFNAVRCVKEIVAWRRRDRFKQDSKSNEEKFQVKM